MIDNLLKDLNRIWHNRERNQLERLKNKYGNEVINLRRHLSTRASYDEVMAKKRIARLKTDVKNAYKEVKQNICLKEKAKCEPSGIEVVDQTIKMASAIQMQKRSFMDENERLKTRLAELEYIVHQEEAEKATYMEGASWMANRLTVEGEKYLKSVDSICQEFRVRKKEKEARGQADPQFLANIQAKFVESIETASNEYKQNIRRIKEGTLYQSTVARENVKGTIGKTGKGIS